MSDTIYIKEHDNGEITLSKNELERIMKEKYNDGYVAGIKTACDMMNTSICNEPRLKITSFSSGIPPIYQFLDKQ